MLESCHRQMVRSASDLQASKVIAEFRKNGTRNCKYKRETEIDHAVGKTPTFRSGFAISGSILQNGFITSRNLTESKTDEAV